MVTLPSGFSSYIVSPGTASPISIGNVAVVYPVASMLTTYVPARNPLLTKEMDNFSFSIFTILFKEIFVPLPEVSEGFLIVTLVILSFQSCSPSYE